MQYRQILQRKFPGIEVIGSNYPPPPKNVAISRIVSFGSMAVIGTTLAGSQVLNMLDMPVPNWLMDLQDKKMGTCMGAWFLGNTIHQNLLSTGAFEIYFDGELISSKLNSGRVPNLQTVLNKLDSEFAKPRSPHKSLTDEDPSDIF